MNFFRYVFLKHLSNSSGDLIRGVRVLSFCQILSHKINRFLAGHAVPNSIAGENEKLEVLCSVNSPDLWESNYHLLRGWERLILLVLCVPD